ncbi:hypothetical protein [Desulfobulbus sp.]|uniref:hypothetical protein n=1 Tax=Desulfobulbus sp. TaxID=895 RepID=UPI00286EFD1C|nr:hypothetical protein [Desulfobulbus sp.]
MKQLYKKCILWLAATDFVRSAIAERADLSAFGEKPTARVLFGVLLIGLSFLLGWPAVAAMGLLSLHWETPWIVAIGGPLVYGFSHLVFLAGMYLSGAVYSLIFCRWLVRVAVERCLAQVAAEVADERPDLSR